MHCSLHLAPFTKHCKVDVLPSVVSTAGRLAVDGPSCAGSCASTPTLIIDLALFLDDLASVFAGLASGFGVSPSAFDATTASAFAEFASAFGVVAATLEVTLGGLGFALGVFTSAPFLLTNLEPSPASPVASFSNTSFCGRPFEHSALVCCRTALHIGCKNKDS